MHVCDPPFHDGGGGGGGVAFCLGAFHFRGGGSPACDMTCPCTIWHLCYFDTVVLLIFLCVLMTVLGWSCLLFLLHCSLWLALSKSRHHQTQLVDCKPQIRLLALQKALTMSYLGPDQAGYDRGLVVTLDFSEEVVPATGAHSLSTGETRWGQLGTQCRQRSEPMDGETFRESARCQAPDSFSLSFVDANNSWLFSELQLAALQNTASLFRRTSWRESEYRCGVESATPRALIARSLATTSLSLYAGERAGFQTPKKQRNLWLATHHITPYTHSLLSFAAMHLFWKRTW